MLNVVYDSLKYAAKLTLAIRCELKNIEEESGLCYFAHAKSTLLERSWIVAITVD